jgi:hypothetical protein
MLDLQSLLVALGHNPNARSKLARHRDSRFNVEEVDRRSHFEFYQSIQRRRVLDDCDMLMSLLGKPGTHAIYRPSYRLLVPQRKRSAGPNNHCGIEHIGQSLGRRTPH